MTIDLPDRSEFLIQTGWLNAAGMLGFAPPATWPIVDAPVAFITNPISYAARPPASNHGCLAFPGGILLHTGWPNPGFRRALSRFRHRWEQSLVPVWVHLMAEHPAEIDAMVRVLEEVEGVIAIEISLLPQMNEMEKFELVKVARGELPLILNVPLDQVGAGWVSRAATEGVSAISLAAPHGMLVGEDGRAIFGRLYGPALLPLALQAVGKLNAYDLPVIAGCGVYDRHGFESMLKAGATAVQLDTVLWRGWESASRG